MAKRSTPLGLKIITIVIVATYSLFFVFQVMTEFQVRATILNHAGYEYNSIVQRFAVQLASAPSVKGDSIHAMYAVLMEEEDRWALTKDLDDGIGVTESSKIRPPAAILDSEGNLLWISEENSVFAQVMESQLQELTFDENNGKLASPTSNTLTQMQPSVRIAKITDDNDRSKEYLIAISRPFTIDVEINSSLSQEQASAKAYYALLSVPLASVFEHIDGILFQQRLQSFSLVAGISIITIIMAFFINRSNRLGRIALMRAEAIEESNRTIHLQQQELATSNNRLEKANEELRLLDRAKDQFISIASHELKNPIQPIISYAEFGKRGIVDKDKAFDEVLNNGRRLKKLTADLLDVTKIDAGNFSYEFSEFKLSELMDEVLLAIKPTVKPGVKLEVNFEEQDTLMQCILKGDRTRLYQVLANVIGNAVKFTEEGFVRVTVKTAYKPQGHVMITVKDSGPGIPAEIIPNLFGKFISSSVKKNNRHGTGLGLYIAKSIVIAHGGTIEARNNNLGELGAQFNIILPLEQSTNAITHPVAVPVEQLKSQNSL